MRRRLSPVLLATTLIAAASVSVASNKITGVRNLTNIQRLTGPGITSVPYDIGGTDLGIPIYHQGKTYLLFGDTFSGEDPTANGNWRRNTVAWTTDTNPANGITLDGWAVDPSTGKAKQTFTCSIPYNPITNIPTGGLSVNGKLYAWFMNVVFWGPVSGQWYINQAELARWNPATTSFELVDNSAFAANGNFGMVAAREGVNGDPYIYLWGTPSGRFGGVKLARFLPWQIENRAAYQFFDGLVDGVPQWTSDEFEADIIIPAPVGEMSVIYNRAVGAWTIMYFDENTDRTCIRQADNPWGPWSAPVTVITSSQAWGGMYGPFMLPQAVENDGQTIYFTLSLWVPYDVYLYKVTLNIAPGGSVSINNGADYANSRSVTLSLPATDDSGVVTQMRISNDGVFDTEPWQSYSPTKAWTLPAGDGVKTVYVRYRDASHYTSDTFSDSIILDTTPPAITAVTASPAMVAQGDPVRISASTTDNNGVVAVMVNEEAGLSKIGEDTWEGLLTAGAPGAYGVRVDATDVAGNVATYSTHAYVAAPVAAISSRHLFDEALARASTQYLFKAYGRVKIIDSDFFELNDGSGIIRVYCRGYSGISNNDYATATGILTPGSDPVLSVQPERVVRVGP